MKKFIQKPIAVALSAALLVSSLGAGAYALNQKPTETAKIETASAAASSNSEDEAVYKDETVYVLAGADGTVEKIIVSDWIKNALGAATLTDAGNLKDVENVKGDESYTLNQNNMRVWDAKGNDIYCKGTTEQALPVNLKVTYKLDGKTVSPTELVGKSGHVTLRYEYQNNQYETVSINGKKEKIYVPFGMLTGALLDNSVFKNVTVTNGKLLNDGDRTAVVGFAFPGLQESLALDSAKFEIPSYFEISADVQGFTLNETVTIATNGIFNEIDTSKFNSVSDLTAGLDKLNSAMTQLVNGSNALYGGLTTLLEKSGQLVQGIDALAAGAGKLKSGTEQLSSGLNELTANNSTLQAGTAELVASVYSTANSQLKQSLAQYAAYGVTAPTLTAKNYATELDKLVKQLSAIFSEENITAQVRAGVLKQVLATVGIEQNTYNNLPAANKAAIDAQVTAAMQGAKAQAQLKAAKEQAAAGLKQITDLKAQLEKVNKYQAGVNNYTNGVASAASGATELKAGTAELYNGILTLKNGAPALVNGVTELKSGSLKLSDGIKQFNSQGVQKLSDAVNGDLGGLVTRLKAVVDVSKNYRSFSGITNEMDGQVKFVYRTAAVDSAK